MAFQYRLRITEPSGTSGSRTISIAELKLYDADDVAISYAGGVFTASATWGGGEAPGSAFDNNPATWWAGPTNTTGNVGWISVTLPGNVLVSRFEIVSRNGDLATTPKRFHLDRFIDDEWVEGPEILEETWTPTQATKSYLYDDEDVIVPTAPTQISQAPIRSLSKNVIPPHEVSFVSVRVLSKEVLTAPSQTSFFSIRALGRKPGRRIYAKIDEDQKKA